MSHGYDILLAVASDIRVGEIGTLLAGKADILRFISDGTVWFGSVIAQNYTP